MNFKYLFQNANFMRIDGSPQSQCRAVERLVRPREVERFIDRNPSPWAALSLPPIAEQVAQWLCSCLASGELSYAPDPHGPLDYWSSPAHTFAWRGGDCEDLTIVGVSMLGALGVSAHVAVGQAWNGSSFDGHAWIEGEDAHGGFLIEATTGAMHRHVRPDVYRLAWRITPNLSRRVA